MAFDAFLKLGDIKGESVADGHGGEIDVLSFSWGVSQMGTTHRGTGGGAGKANVSDISITKWVDSASPTLFLNCCTGKHFPQATLTVRKAGDKPLDYLVIKLTDIIITSVQIGGSSGSEEVTESLSLNFAAFEYVFQPQDNKGAKKGGAITTKFNIAENKAA
jgi:type VI secretion system secreted protein Hcp